MNLKEQVSRLCLILGLLVVVGLILWDVDQRTDMSREYQTIARSSLGNCAQGEFPSEMDPVHVMDLEWNKFSVDGEIGYAMRIPALKKVWKDSPLEKLPVGQRWVICFLEEGSVRVCAIQDVHTFKQVEQAARTAL